MNPDDAIELPFVSTGGLPPAERIEILVAAAHERFRLNGDGRNSGAYAALARMPAGLFGVCVAGTDGRLYSSGDCYCEFTLMSISKPFVFALVCEVLGATAVRERLGVNATGLPFNSFAALEQSGDGRTNPMVNSGAIAATSLVPGDDLDARWRFIHDGLCAFAGRPLAIDAEVYAAAIQTNIRNQAMARLLQAMGRLKIEPVDAIDLYTRQCTLSITAVDLAVMGATLANGGVNPLTGRQVVSANSCRHTLAVMATAGLYEASGDWLYDVGLPGKSGIGGGILAAAPGKCGLGTFAPPLDATGNSVKGQLAATFLSDRLGLNMFASPTRPPPDA